MIKRKLRTLNDKTGMFFIQGIDEYDPLRLRDYKGESIAAELSFLCRSLEALLEMEECLDKELEEQNYASDID